MILKFKVNTLMFKAFSYIIDPPAIEAIVEKWKATRDRWKSFQFLVLSKHFSGIQLLSRYHLVLASRFMVLWASSKLFYTLFSYSTSNVLQFAIHSSYERIYELNIFWIIQPCFSSHCRFPSSSTQDLEINLNSKVPIWHFYGS